MSAMLKKKVDSRKGQTYIPRKVAEKEPESKRVVLTEHKSLSTKPMQTSSKPIISTDNMTYLTSKKEEPSKVKKDRKLPKKLTNKKEAETEEDNVDVDVDEVGSVSPREQATEVKTVFQLPPTQKNQCVKLEDIPRERETSTSKPRYNAYGKAPSEPRDENFVDLEKIKLSGKTLGSGGFSVVHQGIWLGTNVAVKVINITNKKDELKAIEQIKRMIKLRHPRVIELYKYSIDETNSGTHVYMVMQRMQSDLSIYRFRDFSDKLRVIRQIVEGLRMLHEESIVHRDLKPQNILVDGKGDIRLADLGISALLDSEQPKSMTVAFTLKYAPPEVCIDSITHLQNDIWSLGLVIYEILTGSGPWNNHKKQEIMKGLFSKQFPLDKDWQQRIEIVADNQETAAILIELIRSCLNVEMLQRPTIGNVQEQLAAVTNSTY